MIDHLKSWIVEPMRTFSYILRRTILLFPILLGISVLTFCMTHVLPGDPLYIILSPYAKEEDVQKARIELGLDKPLYVQYGYYLQDLLQGDFGDSYRTQQPVLEDLKQRFPITLELTTLSMLLAVMVAIPLGVQAAVHKDTWIDHFTRVLSVGGVSIPIFWTGIVLIFIFYYKFGIAPAPIGRLDMSLEPPTTITGMFTVDSLLTGNWEALRSSLSHLFLPVVTLAFAMTAPILRVTRNSMLEALNSNYLRTAISLGIENKTVIYRDALKNALLPVVTSIGQVYGWSLGGEVLVEVTFSWPGMGYYAVNSIINNDFAPVQGFVLLTAAIYVLIYLLLDLLYSVIDPRIVH